jgi:hypothetical protein
MGNMDGSPFGLDHYVQIASCVTYRRLSLSLAAFSDQSRVAPHVVGMLLAIVAHVFGARSVLFLLLRINLAKVIWVLRAPSLIGLPPLLLAAVRPTTGHLPFFDAWMGMKPTTTERTPRPRQHRFLLQAKSFRRNKAKKALKKKKEAKGKGYWSELTTKKEKKSETSFPDAAQTGGNDALLNRREHQPHRRRQTRTVCALL